MALIDDGTRPRLLALRALGLGDFLTGVPALRALRRAFPGHELVLAAPTALTPLVSLADVADSLLPAGGLQALDWAGSAPDLAVNLHGKGPQTHELLGALSPRRLVAFGSAEAGFEGPAWRPGEHEIRRWCRLLEEALDIDTDVDDLLLRRPASSPLSGADAVVVHPGAAFPARRWPADRFAEVAHWATTQGHEVVVTGGPGEEPLAHGVATLAGLPDRAVLAGRTDLATLAGVVAHARLVVCGDTGVAHLASAFGTPSVVLFGPVSPAEWGPPAKGPHTVLWHGAGDGDPWGETTDPTLLQIGVGEVLAAAQARLSDSR